MIARMTRPDGWVVLNADDPLVAGVARRVRAHVAFFSSARAAGCGPAAPPGGRRARLRARAGPLVERHGRPVERRSSTVADVPIALGGLARHNVANALAAAGGARAMGATIAEVARGAARLPAVGRALAGTAEHLPASGNRVVIVDFAHNEAGLAAVLDVAEGIAGGAAGRAAPVTAIIGTAGDRPDDTLRGIGRIAGAARPARRDQGDAALPARPDARIDRRRAAGGHRLRRAQARPPRRRSTRPRRPRSGPSWRGGDSVAPPGSRPDAARVVVLMCHEERAEVYHLLEELGARPVDVASELTALVPRLQSGRESTDRAS